MSTEKKEGFCVALSTANPPHTHWTTSVPIYGIADNRFVMTVAPQNDICPRMPYNSHNPNEVF
jgi:hypothetical protein